MEWRKNVFWHCIKLFMLYMEPSDSVQIMSRGQSITVNSGQSLTLECQVFAESFSLFDNPVVWLKTQHLEECQISMMGNTMEPFASDQRFKPSYAPPTATTLKYLFELSIINVSLEDSGNYTCQIYGPLNSVIASVTYYVLVRVLPQLIIISTKNTTHFPHPHFPVKEIEIVLEEKTERTVRCLAVGGYPPIDMDIYVGQQNLTNKFTILRTNRITGGRCMKVVEQVVERWSNRVTVSAEDDESQLRCVVTVPGLPPDTAFVKLTVHFSPVIDCKPASASVGDVDLHLTCKVTARPEITTLFWVTDVKGTTVSQRQLNDEYFTSVMVLSDGSLDARLHIRLVRSNSFHTYTLVAENVIGSSYKDIFLQQRFPSTMLTTPSVYLVEVDLKLKSSAEFSESHKAKYSHNPKMNFEPFFHNLALAISQHSCGKGLAGLILVIIDILLIQYMFLLD